MPFVRGLSIAVAGSLCLALVISLLPSVQLSGRDMAAWAPQGTAYISAENVSDVVTALPGHQSVLRVVWHEGQIALDIQVPKEAAAQSIYQQSFDMVKALLTQTKNVDEVLLRFYDKTSGEDDLVASLVAARENLKQDPGMENPQGLDLNLYLSHYFLFSKTPYWYQRMPQLDS